MQGPTHFPVLEAAAQKADALSAACMTRPFGPPDAILQLRSTWTDAASPTYLLHRVIHVIHVIHVAECW
eukprot:360461-Chlamydomonas_euryale.AAC.2